MMVNGAFFVPSGEGLEDIYDKASSTDPKSSALVDVLTQNAGVLGDPRYVRTPDHVRHPVNSTLFLTLLETGGPRPQPLVRGPA